MPNVLPSFIVLEHCFNSRSAVAQLLARDVQLHGDRRGTGGITNGTSLEQVIMYLLRKDEPRNLPKVSSCDSAEGTSAVWLSLVNVGSRSSGPLLSCGRSYVIGVEVKPPPPPPGVSTVCACACLAASLSGMALYYDLSQRKRGGHKKPLLTSCDRCTSSERSACPASGRSTTCGRLRRIWRILQLSLAAASTRSRRCSVLSIVQFLMSEASLEPISAPTRMLLRLQCSASHMQAVCNV